MGEEETIEFFGKVGDWVCIKKGKIDEKTDNVEIARILTSIQNSIDRKKYDFLKDEINIPGLDALAEELAGERPGRVSSEKLSELFAKLNGPGIGRKIGELVKGKVHKEVAKTYLTRMVFDKFKFRIDLDSKTLEKLSDEKKKMEMAE